MKIYLRALEPEDFETTYIWRSNEADWNIFVGMKRFVSKDTERKWVLSAIEKHERGEAFSFGICDQESRGLIGMIAAKLIDYHNRTFHTSSLIGDVDRRNKGVILHARIKFLRYMFLEVGMNKAISQVIESNVASLRSLEKFGYMREGVLRQAVFKHGEYQNIVIHGLLRDEFNELYPESGLSQ